MRNYENHNDKKFDGNYKNTREKKQMEYFNEYGYKIDSHRFQKTVLENEWMKSGPDCLNKGKRNRNE